MRYLGYRELVRSIVLLALLVTAQACASASQMNVALAPRAPQDVLAAARSQLKSRGFTVAERASTPADTTKGRSALGGDLRAEHLIGRDMDTGGILFEVIEVTATPVPETGQTRVTVRGGMESMTSLGMWVRVPSTRHVRQLAEELLRKLSEQ
jgi:hypothetical protein